MNLLGFTLTLIGSGIAIGASVVTLATGGTVFATHIDDTVAGVLLAVTSGVVAWLIARIDLDMARNLNETLKEGRDRAIEEKAVLQAKIDSDAALHEEARKAWEERKKEIGALSLELAAAKDLNEIAAGKIAEYKKAEHGMLAAIDDAREEAHRYALQVEKLEKDIQFQRETNNNLTALCQKQQEHVSELKAALKRACDEVETWTNRHDVMAQRLVEYSERYGLQPAVNA